MTILKKIVCIIFFWLEEWVFKLFFIYYGIFGQDNIFSILIFLLAYLINIIDQKVRIMERLSTIIEQKYQNNVKRNNLAKYAV